MVHATHDARVAWAAPPRGHGVGRTNGGVRRKSMHARAEKGMTGFVRPPAAPGGVAGRPDVPLLEGDPGPGRRDDEGGAWQRKRR
jgi:hypothetical protein